MADITVTKDNFEEEVLKSDKPVLVDFWADWCQPCKMTEPIIEELAKEHGDKMKIVKVDVDANPEISQQFGVMSIPTFLFFKNGQPVETLIGVHPKSEFDQKIAAHT